MQYLAIVIVLVCMSGSDVCGLAPKKEYMRQPHDLHIPYEKITITSSQGAQLNAWYFPSDKGNLMIILSHDGVGNMGDYLSRVKALVDYGFDVICYDYRGYGQSSEFVIAKTIYIYKEFYEDFDAVYGYCVQNYHQPIFLYGWGIGAGISIVSGYQKNNISGIVADDPFVSFDGLKTSFLQMNAVMTIPNDVLASDSLQPISVVQNKAGEQLGGILILHGANNYLISPTDLHHLLEKTSLANKELYRFSKAVKMDNFTPNATEYIRKIYVFAINL